MANANRVGDGVRRGIDTRDRAVAAVCDPDPSAPTARATRIPPTEIAFKIEFVSGRIRSYGIVVVVRDPHGVVAERDRARTVGQGDRLDHSALGRVDPLDGSLEAVGKPDGLCSERDPLRRPAGSGIRSAIEAGSDCGAATRRSSSRGKSSGTQTDLASAATAQLGSGPNPMSRKTSRSWTICVFSGSIRRSVRWQT